MRDLRSCLGEADRDAIERICGLFAEVDGVAERFKTLTGIRCPDGCGECCSSPRVEASEAEMLPLALELWSGGTAGRWLERIEAAEDNPVCVFFRAEPGSPARGRCEIYGVRPLICRLYGFFPKRNKYGKYVYSGCRVIRREYPEIYAKAARMLGDMKHPFSSTDYALHIIGADSGYGRSIVPINRAASAALKKIGYRLDHFPGGRV